MLRNRFFWESKFSPCSQLFNKHKIIPDTPEGPIMRSIWNTLSNETKRDDSVELFRFFIFGEVWKPNHSHFYSLYFLLYFLYEKTTSRIHTVILNTDVLNTFL